MPSLKEVYKRLNDVKIDADSINLNTDGLESLLATTQADIALIKADLANGVLSDVRDGTGNAITSSARGSQRALSVQVVDVSGGQIQPLTDTQLRASSVPVSLASLPSLAAGSAQIGVVSITQATTPAVTSFISLTSATLIASNASRKMLTIQNVGAGILYVLFGSGTASTSNFSVRINSGEFYENNYYSGQMNAIFATAGTAYITSLT
jgi:hypothetical protein